MTHKSDGHAHENGVAATCRKVQMIQGCDAVRGLCAGPDSSKSLLLLAVIGRPPGEHCCGSSEVGWRRPPQSRGFSSNLKRWAGAPRVLGSCLPPALVAGEF